MRSQETLRAWLEYAQEILQLNKAAVDACDYIGITARDAEGLRLWDACLADGWTREEGERALRDSEED